jgi:F-type H+-transporting ATPase subunit a
VELTPDQNVLWEWGAFRLNETMAVTWGLMLVMVLVSALVTRRLSVRPETSRRQLALEIVVRAIRGQIREAVQDDPDPYLPFVGTLFLFIALSSLVGAFPGVTAPTASLSTAAALALIVFVAVPVFGIARQGLAGYLRHYVRPSPFMLPFHLISELSRTLALAVRLFGNIMSGTLIVAILVSVVPFFVPVVLEAFGLLIGFIQAYVFAVLSLVYIASASRSQREEAARSEGRNASDPQPKESSHGSR